MFLEVGKTYKATNGRQFIIVGKKTISTTGFNYIGECKKTGLIAYFNAEGHHAHQSELWLEVDKWKYIPVKYADFIKGKEFTEEEIAAADFFIAIDGKNLSSLTFFKAIPSD